MTHAIKATRYGWLVFSHLGSLVLTASLFDTHGEALDAWALLAYGGGQ